MLCSFLVTIISELDENYCVHGLFELKNSHVLLYLVSLDEQLQRPRGGLGTSNLFFWNVDFILVFRWWFNVWSGFCLHDICSLSIPGRNSVSSYFDVRQWRKFCTDASFDGGAIWHYYLWMYAYPIFLLTKGCIHLGEIIDRRERIEYGDIPFSSQLCLFTRESFLFYSAFFGWR